MTWRKRWKKASCPNCDGHGMVFVVDYGADECSDCGGSGVLWVSEGDATADWPGGPFRGRWPGKFAKLEAAGVSDELESCLEPTP